MKRLFLYGAICFAAFTGTAHAQLVERLCGGNMPCSYAQFTAGEAAWFRQADTNHDGIVEAAEQDAVWRSYAADILPACGDMQDIKTLKLTHIPTDEQSRKNFTAVDTNGDGIIDLQEDQQATIRLNQTCQLMRDPQVQKMKQLFQQWQQRRQ